MILSIVLQSCSSPAIVLLVLACLSRRALGSMRILHFTALALVAGLTCATPVPSESPITTHSTSSLPGITSTSIDATAFAVSDLPTFGSCRAFYYDPKDDVPCGVVARQFVIFLTYPEYDQPSTAQWCEIFLNGNGICRATSPNSPSVFPTTRPSTLSISTVAPTTDNVASVASSSDATGSPVPAIVSGSDSAISAASPAATASTKMSSTISSSTRTSSTRVSSTRTSSRGPVVLASVRGSEFSASVHQRSTTASGKSAQAHANIITSPSSDLAAAETNSPATGSLRSVIDTTRMISYTMGHGNATSIKTVLVTAHVAPDAATAGAVTIATEVASVANSTRAIRRVKARRQASLLASSMNATYQVVNVEPPVSEGTLNLLDSITAAQVSSLAVATSTEPSASPAASVESILFQPTPTSLQPSAATSSVSLHTASSVESPASEPATSWSERGSIAEANSEADLASSSAVALLTDTVPSSTSVEAAETSSATIPSEAGATTSASASAELVSTTLPGISQPSVANVGADQYVSFHGDGSSEQGWPLISEWMAWDDLVAANRNNLASACTYWQVQENSAEEIVTLLGLIVRVAGKGGLDPRVVLAMILQESHGCLRVPSTMGSHKSTGILQSHIGNGSCNTNTITSGEPGPVQDNSLVWETCPSSQIEVMVRDGALGTSAGNGLVQFKNQEQSAGYRDAQMWYRIAQTYNSGSIDASNKLEVGAATPGYASDIANRLTGWKTGLSQFA